jgi:hypothetical protein
VIAGQAIGQDRHLRVLKAGPEALSILVSVAGEAEKELPVVAAMGQVVQPAWDKVAISPWHKAETSRSVVPFGVKKPWVKTAAKALR